MKITRLLFNSCRTRFTLLTMLSTIVTPLTAYATGQLDYKLEIDAALNVVSGQVCGADITTEQFSLAGAMQWLKNRAQDIPQQAQQSCLHYQLQLDAQKDADRFSRYLSQAKKRRIALTTVSDLLPCPHGHYESKKIVGFNLPPGTAISMPGEALTNNRFSLLSRPCDWSSGILVGGVSNKLLIHGESKINVAMPSTLSIAHQKKLIQWLTSGIDALSRAHGIVPVKDTQVLIFPTGPNEEAVPWGQVMRGGGDSVHIYVDETKTLEELNADWVLVHELSHLLHPYLVGEDGWLAEGIASYYQNVLRARNGLLDQQLAWRKLLAGFRRGENQFSPDTNLRDDTRRLMRERKYMRVYWSGAAIALLADIQLRLESDGERSLDTVLGDFSACCLPTTNRKWRALDLMKRFDELGNTDIFLRLYEKYVRQAEFPSLQQAYQDLGLSKITTGVEFDTNPDALHQAIMTSR